MNAWKDRLVWWWFLCVLTTRIWLAEAWFYTSTAAVILFWLPLASWKIYWKGRGRRGAAYNQEVLDEVNAEMRADMDRWMKWTLDVEMWIRCGKRN